MLWIFCIFAALIFVNLLMMRCAKVVTRPRPRFRVRVHLSDEEVLDNLEALAKEYYKHEKNTDWHKEGF